MAQTIIMCFGEAYIRGRSRLPITGGMVPKTSDAQLTRNVRKPSIQPDTPTLMITCE